MELRGRVVLVTGASQGVGAACANALAAAGAHVVLAARNPQALPSVQQAGQLSVSADVTREDDRQRLVDQALAWRGRIDILINNAGRGLYQPSWQEGLAETRALFELNLFAPWALTQLVMPHMRTQGSGMVVNIGSIAGRVPLPWMTAYSASKSALGMWTAGLRMELASSGVHAMLVCPGYVQTAFHSHAAGGQPPAAVQRAKRFAITPEQCATAILQGIRKEAHTVLTPLPMRAFSAVYGLLPQAVERRLIALLHSR